MARRRAGGETAGWGETAAAKRAAAKQAAAKQAGETGGRGEKRPPPRARRRVQCCDVASTAWTLQETIVSRGVLNRSTCSTRAADVPAFPVTLSSLQELCRKAPYQKLNLNEII